MRRIGAAILVIIGFGLCGLGAVAMLAGLLYSGDPYVGAALPIGMIGIGLGAAVLWAARRVSRSGRPPQAS